jgi:uncharacterized protein
LRIINADGGSAIADSVEHASSLWARSRGLLGRKGLGKGEGLLLDPCSGIHTFGMAFPIDAIFLNREGKVVHLVQEMGPFRMSRYAFSAKTVLELPAGTIRESGVRVGDRLVLED